MMPQERTYYGLQPLLPLSEAWQWGIAAFVLSVLIGFVIWMYRGDARDQPRSVAWMFVGLRCFALLLLLTFVLNPQLRSETRISKNSRLAVLIDTSLSMVLKDNFGASSEAALPTRLERGVAGLGGQPVLNELRKSHDVAIYRFGESSQSEEVAFLPKLIEPRDENVESNSAANSNSESGALWMAYVAMGLATVAIIALVIWGTRSWMAFEQTSLTAWFAAVGVLLLVSSLLTAALSDLARPNTGLFGFLTANEVATPVPPEAIPPTPIEKGDADTDWKAAFVPTGTSTRLGSALQDMVHRERGGPIAGIVVVTDGQSNSGLEPTRALAAATNAGIPIFPIGIGTTEMPKNIQVADVQAPPRVFPGDKFQIKGFIKSFGMEGQTIRVDLYSVDEKESEAETLEAETTVRLLADGQSVPVEFEAQRDEQGKRRYLIRTARVEGDKDERDNQRGTVVEIVDRKTRVLLIAGGPTREFRFLRNQLYRDKDVVLHVWLQTARAGADQESDELLLEFPQNREALFQFDCVIAFDPDWRELDANQAELLERWVAEKAGGMIVVAGPVNMPEWTRRPRGDQTIDKIKRLYPVSFYSQGSAVLKLGRFGGVAAFPLSFTREGRAAEFLWMGDSSSESQQTWGQFDGVFGYYAVNEAKPGADVLANFADPATKIDSRLPIYLASQFYGAGRVFFQASGEMWRVRRVDVEYFQNYYLQLVRWVSQGRLLRDSTRGVLLTDREQCWMGDQVTVQAILRDAQDEPLVGSQIESVLSRPDGSSQTLVLRSVKDAVRAGTFTAQFSASQEGEYRVRLPIPDSTDFEVLTTQVQANIPDLEKEKPQRNDELLSELAEKSRGHYFVGMDRWNTSPDDPLSPVQLIQPQDQETLLLGTPNRGFEKKLAQWLLILIVSVFCLEWTFRRLHKLA